MEQIPEHWSRFPEQAKQKVSDFGIPPSDYKQLLYISPFSQSYWHSFQLY